MGFCRLGPNILIVIRDRLTRTLVSADMLIRPCPRTRTRTSLIMHDFQKTCQLMLLDFGLYSNILSCLVNNFMEVIGLSTFNPKQFRRPMNGEGEPNFKARTIFFHFQNAGRQDATRGPITGIHSLTEYCVRVHLSISTWHVTLTVNSFFTLYRTVCYRYSSFTVLFLSK